MAHLLLLFSIFLFAGEVPKEQVLHTYTQDVTGDGQEETVTLYGIPLKENKDFFEKVWAIVKGDGKEMRINYEGGFEPALEFADFTHDGVNELFYSSATGGSGGLHNYAIDSLKDWKRTELPLPFEEVVGHFEDDFQAVIKIPSLKKPIRVDLTDRKADYICLGLFQKNGQLNEPTELMVIPISFMEIIQLKDDGSGLKSYQQISGAYHADGIGTVETVWKWEKDQWVPVETVWVES